MATDFIGKNLEILKDCLPKLSSVVLLYNPNSGAAHRHVEEAQAAADSLSIRLSLVKAESSDQLSSAIVAFFVVDSADVLIIRSNPLPCALQCPEF